jgi:hypothetical protein
MLENLSQEDKSKLILNQEALERVKQEQLNNQETSPEAIQKKIQEEIQKIETYSEQITDIPEYQEKQITDLGGDTTVVEEKLKPEFNVLKSIRENVSGRFAKVASTLGLISSLNTVTAGEYVNSSQTEKWAGRDHFINPEKLGKRMEDAATESYKDEISKLLKIKIDPVKFIEESSKKRFDFLSTPEGQSVYLEDLQKSKERRLESVKDLEFLIKRYSEKIKSEESLPEIERNIDYIKQQKEYLADNQSSEEHNRKQIEKLDLEINQISIGTWQPSMETIKKEYEDEVKQATDPESGGVDEKLKSIFEDIKESVEQAKAGAVKNKQSFEEYDKQLEWVNRIIQSPEYMQRAFQYEGLTIDDILSRKENINKKDYNLTNSRFEDPNYNPATKEVIFQQVGDDLEKTKYTGIHEFTHQSTDGNEKMSQYAKDLYQKAFTGDNLSPTEKQRQDMFNFEEKQRTEDPDDFSNKYSSGFDFLKYYSAPTELDARKKVTESFMEQQGIKKYEETFTKEHYQKLLDLQKQGKLPDNADQFIRLIKPEYIEQIMNTIADVSTDYQDSINKTNQT